MTDASFPFQAKDWQSSEAVRLMSLAERGAFIGLLAASWVAGGEYPCTIPDDDRAIATLLGVSLREWKTVAKAVRNQFESAPNSRLRNARLYGEWVALQQRRKAKSEGGSRGAARRWRASAPLAPTPNSDGIPNGIANGIAIGSANGSAIRVWGGC